MSNQELVIEPSETPKWKGSPLIKPLNLIGLFCVTIGIASLTYFNISNEKKIVELERLASVDTLHPLVYDRLVTESDLGIKYDTVTIDTYRYIYGIEGTERKGNWTLINQTGRYSGPKASIPDTLFLTRREHSIIDSIIANSKTSHRTTGGFVQ